MGRAPQPGAYVRRSTAWTAPTPRRRTRPTPRARCRRASQRTTGWELGAPGSVTDAWQVTGGFSQQRAEIISTDRRRAEGAQVPLVPRRTLSLWNR